MTDKSPEAFRTISEVAEDLDLPQHVLRFWETRFSQIKPMKRGGGRRYYRPEDVNLLRGIRFLLYGEGYTIKGVQRILKEHGIRHVASIWQEAAPAPAGQNGPAGHASANEVPLPPAAASEAALARDVPAPVPPSEFAPSEFAPPPRVAPADPPEIAEPPAVASTPPVDQPAPATPALAVIEAPAAPPALSPEDVRHLKAALFELIECKRILDTARQSV